MAAVDQGRGAAAVEVDRVRRAERDQESGELGEVEAGIDADEEAGDDRLRVVSLSSASRMRVMVGR